MPIRQNVPQCSKRYSTSLTTVSLSRAVAPGAPLLSSFQNLTRPQTSFCNDYRKVNAITKPDSFPLPRMDDCVDCMGSAKYVTKLDFLKGYWQVPLTKRASDISAFVTPDHFLQYTIMLFGLRNAPATFQRLMNTVLCGVNNCDVSLDDIVAHLLLLKRKPLLISPLPKRVVTSVHSWEWLGIIGHFVKISLM